MRARICRGRGLSSAAEPAYHCTDIHLPNEILWTFALAVFAVINQRALTITGLQAIANSIA